MDQRMIWAPGTPVLAARYPKYPADLVQVAENFDRAWAGRLVDVFRPGLPVLMADSPLAGNIASGELQPCVVVIPNFIRHHLFYLRDELSERIISTSWLGGFDLVQGDGCIKLFRDYEDILPDIEAAGGLDDDDRYGFARSIAASIARQHRFSDFDSFPIDEKGIIRRPDR